jgi:hypothetical protein
MEDKLMVLGYFRCSKNFDPFCKILKIIETALFCSSLRFYEFCDGISRLLKFKNIENEHEIEGPAVLGIWNSYSNLY